jgi:hypothetical protein
MKLTLAVIGMTITCVNLETRALAQQGAVYPGPAGGVSASAAGGYGMITSSIPYTTTGAPGSSIGAGSVPPAQQVLLPYSYYAVAPAPARIYVPYGQNDQFPFLGRAYGNPGDRWSWYTLGGGSSRYLARYYYPPLR